jgi:hypothetical protein
MQNQGDARPFQVQLDTGDSYCRERDIQRIDLLKIDTEGAEHKVLAGFDQMLKAEAIDIIQFEFGQANIETHFLLKDFFELLTPCGYQIGKLHPCSVEFHDYHYDMQDFVGPNFVAVRGDRCDVIKRISAT